VSQDVHVKLSLLPAPALLHRVIEMLPVLAKAPPGLRLAILQARQIKILG
jgi:hypothetical protein